MMVVTSSTVAEKRRVLVRRPENAARTGGQQITRLSLALGRISMKADSTRQYHACLDAARGTAYPHSLQLNPGI